MTKKKGMYFDGHEREDVIESRSIFLTEMATLEQQHPPPPAINNIPSPPPSSGKILVTIVHDETAFNANDDQRFMWADDDMQVLRPKGRGSGVMVSDFIDEHRGFLRLTDAELEDARKTHPEIRQEARELLEYGENRDGFWTCEKFMKHVQNAVAIAEYIYPPDKYTICWRFDNASTHTKMPADALNASAMNVNPGGKQPKMHETKFVHPQTGQLIRQEMQTNGTPKGLKAVLCERGIDVSNMKKDAMITELSSHTDFKSEQCILAKYISQRGHIIKFIPKFHVEFSPIEPVWCHAKCYTRSKCNYSIVGLRKHIRPALESLPGVNSKVL